MLKTEELSRNVIKICADSNCYLIEKSILIDTSLREYRKQLMETINSITPLKNIKKVIFTHLHYDHIGNFDIFQRAEFFASKRATILIKDIHKKSSLILDREMADRFIVNLQSISDNKELSKKFQLIDTPGHCMTAVILYYKKDNVLFTGDTYFREGVYGRVDLPASKPELMEQSVQKVKDMIEKHDPVIAPGHDY